MNAPEPAVHTAVPLFRIPLANIAPSPNQPRRRFLQAPLDELTESIRQHGVIEPVLVRPVSGHKNPAVTHELVFGERRYRASKAAGLIDVPAMVRDIGPKEALELQVIENLQREGLHELEEAEGYERLMKEHKYTVDEIAAKIGMGRGYVYARLKLTALCRKARDAFYDGKFDVSHALLLARIPVESLQLEALKAICRESDGSAVPFRHAADIVHRQFMLRLADAPFNVKDAALVKSAGACGDCPKRTGNQPELFSDVQSGDVCTDPTCFGAKKAAHYVQVRVAAESAGKKIISGTAAEKIVPYGEHNLQQGFVRADDKIWLGNKQEKVSALIKKVDVETQLLEAPKSGDIVEIVSSNALQAALKKAGLVKNTPSESARRSNANAAREREKHKLEIAYRKRAFEALCGRLTQTDTGTHENGALVACGLWDHSDYATRVAFLERWGWMPPKDPKAKKSSSSTDWNAVEKAKLRIAELKPADLWRLMIELVCYPDIQAPGKPEQLASTATRHGVDLAAIRREIDGAAKGKTAKPAKKPAAKKAATAPVIKVPAGRPKLIAPAKAAKRPAPAAAPASAQPPKAPA